MGDIMSILKCAKAVYAKVKWAMFTLKDNYTTIIVKRFRMSFDLNVISCVKVLKNIFSA